MDHLETLFRENRFLGMQCKWGRSFS